MFEAALIQLLDGYKKGDPKKKGDFFEYNPEKKQEADWYLKLGWQVLHDYVNDRFAWTDARSYYAYTTRRISTLRQYAAGIQPIEKYQDILCPESSYLTVQGANGQMIRQAMMNISFSPPKIFPIFKSAVKAQLLETGYDFEVSGVDPSSSFDKKLEVAYKKIKMQPYIQELKQQAIEAGVPIPPDEEVFGSEKEIDIMQENGGFRLQYEIELKKALQKTLNKSTYDGIRDMLYDDAIELGLYMTKSYIDDLDGTPKVRYVDPEYFIGAWDRHHDRRDMWLGAEMIPMTLSDLIHKTKLTKDQALHVMNTYGQRIDQNSWAQAGDNIIGMQKYNILNDMRVWVLDCNFISTDVEKNIKYKSRTFGNYVFKSVPFDYELKEKDKDRGVKLYEYKYEHEYGFKMIVGTDVVFDFGKTDTIRDRENKSEARLSYTVYDTKQPSLVDRCVEFIDDACLSVFKWRDAVAKMPPPPRIQVESASIDQVNLGGVTLTALQAKDMLSQTGWLHFKSLSDHLEPVTGNYNAPITSMNIDLMQDFNVFQGGFSTAMNMIRQVTGINETMDASTPNPRQGYKVSKLAYDSSKQTLKPLIFGYEMMFLNMLRKCNQLWLQIAAEGDKKGAFNSLGDGLKIFEIASSLPDRDFDVELQVLPNEEERIAVLNQLMQLRDARIQTGVGGITPDTFFLVYRIIKTGNLQLAQYKMAQAAERQRQQDIEEKERAEQANTDRLIAAAQESNKAKEIEAQAKSQQIQQQADLDLRNMVVEMLMKNGIEQQKAVVTAEMAVAQANAVPPLQAYHKIKPFLDEEIEKGMEQPEQPEVEQEEIIEEKM